MTSTIYTIPVQLTGILKSLILGYQLCSYSINQGWRKILEIGGGGTDDGEYVSTHMLGVSEGMLLRNCFKIRGFEITSEAIFVPSPTRVHGRNNMAFCHDTRQSSCGISVTIVDLVHACRA